MNMAASILQFHAGTEHTPASVRRRGGRRLDWENRPQAFKEYPDLTPIPLPSPEATPEGPSITLETLSHLLYYSAGVTRTRRFNGEKFYFRAYACAGALYPIEVYVVAQALDGLAAGVYHFHPRERALRLLRPGDHRDALVAAAAGASAISRAPVTLVLTGLYWRTAWKYEARGYRHLYWDSGMMLANLLALAAARRIDSEVVIGFVDAAVDRLLGLDGHDEVSLALVPLGTGSPAPPSSGLLPALHLNVAPLSARPVDYPAIHAAHAAGILEQPSDVALWRTAGGQSTATKQGGRDQVLATQLAPLLAIADPVEEVIRRRGSTRLFAREAIAAPALSTILHAASFPLAGDFRPLDAPLNEVYLIVNAVDRLEPGAYILDRDPLRLRPLQRGNFRRQAGFLCLEQPLAADAAAVALFMADLPGITARLGGRGYRAAQLEAGIRGGRMYLSAYGQRLGATGLTFYDGEVTRFFSPGAEGLDPMLAIAVGRDGRRFPTVALTAKG